jgi:hypothetical protein
MISDTGVLANACNGPFSKLFTSIQGHPLSTQLTVFTFNNLKKEKRNEMSRLGEKAHFCRKKITFLTLF